MLFNFWFVHHLISFSCFSFVEAALLMACLVWFLLLFWPSPRYSRKFGLRLRGKVVGDEIWQKQKAAAL
jgi:hypothetical protein